MAKLQLPFVWILSAHHPQDVLASRSSLSSWYDLYGEGDWETRTFEAEKYVFIQYFVETQSELTNLILILASLPLKTLKGVTCLENPIRLKNTVLP